LPSATTTNGIPYSVTGVEFFDGAVKLGSAESGGGNTWHYSWYPSGTALGWRSLTAKATDSGGLTATSTPITVKVCIPGDGNGDGSVDGLDYNCWQNGYQQPGAVFQTGDYNGDGSVDGLDYNVWQNNYNHSATYSSEGFGPMAAVPATETTSQTTAPASAVAAANAPHLVAVTPTPCSSVSDVMSLTLVFDSSVQIGAGAVEVSGLATGENHGFAQTHDAATNALTLTWTKTLPADTYTVRVVADFVTGGDGAPLDGEVGDAAAPMLPSGDGIPGGDSLLEFTAR